MSEHPWTGRKRIGGYTLTAGWQPDPRPRREEVLRITFTRKAAPGPAGQSVASCGAEKEGRSDLLDHGDEWLTVE